MPDELKRPGLSVVILTPDCFATISRTVQHLSVQTARDRIELVIVAPSKNALAPSGQELDRLPWIRVVECGEIRVPAAAKAAGVREAAAPVVVFAEDHCYPEPEWAAALIAAHQDPSVAAVGPVIVNHNPERMVSWADFYINYGPWASPTEGGACDHLPGHNSSYKRELLLAFGSRLEFLLSTESVLHWELRAQGLQLLLDPHAKARHTNISRFSSFLGIQFVNGRLFAAVRAEQWPFWRRLVYCVGSPLLPVLRSVRVLRQISATRKLGELVPGILPSLAGGLVASATGEMVGYALGAGRTAEDQHEFHRERFLAETPAPEVALREK